MGYKTRYTKAQKRLSLVSGKSCFEPFKFAVWVVIGVHRRASAFIGGLGSDLKQLDSRFTIYDLRFTEVPR